VRNVILLKNKGVTRASKGNGEWKMENAERAQGNGDLWHLGRSTLKIP
jgi:hypothetical protein